LKIEGILPIFYFIIQNSGASQQKDEEHWVRLAMAGGSDFYKSTII